MRLDAAIRVHFLQLWPHPLTRAIRRARYLLKTAPALIAQQIIQTLVRVGPLQQEHDLFECRMQLNIESRTHVRSSKSSGLRGMPCYLRCFGRCLALDPLPTKRAGIQRKYRAAGHLGGLWRRTSADSAGCSKLGAVLTRRGASGDTGGATSLVAACDVLEASLGPTGLLLDEVLLA